MELGQSRAHNSFMSAVNPANLSRPATAHKLRLPHRQQRPERVAYECPVGENHQLPAHPAIIGAGSARFSAAITAAD
jgi:hypothetical protein